ncbi:MAG: hypothetical protein WBG32_14595, partial [Nodosilinea sp.]
QRLCELFPYRWASIEGANDSSTNTRWRTVRKYPLKPRTLFERYLDPGQLVGVRFGNDTRYGLLDIDAGSPYLDQLPTIAAALETIGIVRWVPIRSSSSGGLHLYLPLPEDVPTFALACALQQAMTSQGLAIKQGQLEIFPNVKAHAAYWKGEFTEYNAHRLPLQPGTGAAILNGDMSPESDSLSHFFALWDNCAAQQDPDDLRQALAIARDNQRKRRRRKNVNPVATWRADLENEINEGWSGPGQTNGLLKAIACYGRVFEGLDGHELAHYVERIAITRPGYLDHCRHQREITLKAKAWANAAEKYYWPLGTEPVREKKTYSVNQQRMDEARSRIAIAAAEIRLNAPGTVRGWVQRLVELAHTSVETLYKHRDLWHPDGAVTPQPEGDTATTPPPIAGSPGSDESREFSAVTVDAPFNEGCSLTDLLKNLPLGGRRGGAGGEEGFSTGGSHA